MSDLLLRKSSVSRAGAEAPDDYDVIGADGLIIGRIFGQAPHLQERSTRTARL